MPTITRNELALLTDAADKPYLSHLERYWMGVMTGRSVAHADRLVGFGLAEWSGNGNSARLVATDKGRSVVEVNRPKPGTRIYPAWDQTCSGEGFDRAQSLANDLTDEDRRAGRNAPVHGYSGENFARAEAIVRASNRYAFSQPIPY